MHNCCCSHFGQWNLLRRRHWIWQSCRLLGHLTGGKSGKPGSASFGLASSAQICASAPSGALLSSERGRHRWACRSSPFRSSHLLPASTSDGMDKLRSTRQTCWTGPNILFEISFFFNTFWASSCLSKLTNPNPRDFPPSSVMTRMLMAFPAERESQFSPIWSWLQANISPCC